MIPADHSLPASVLEQASDWVFRQQGALGEPPPRADFEAWLAADPRHGEAWRLACATWGATGALAPVFAAPPRPLCRPPRRKRPSKPLVALALAACLAAFVVLSPLRLLWQADHLTGSGESATVSLRDGSRVALAADSALSTRISEAGRAVTLLKGQAFFQVAPDRTRPFVVSGGGVSVTVTGTAFDVALDDGRVTVAVAEGGVRVDYQGRSERLVPGEKVSVDPAMGEIRRAAVDPADVAAWRQGRLVSDNQRLSAVIEALRRQYSGVIVLTDAALGETPVTGVYDLEDPERALRALVSPFGGTVRRLTPYLLVVSPP
ncbi:putative FecR [Rhodospirillum rubrum F11]|uniref:FecR n=2 Tax=Rhodospirillum rubrum TaxID=1085 RepID=Q2RW10_RHORT|nr:FecR domain-containing protein [Rhodospirillum rubrum]ABC21685.1 Putative FecR [Rhodospirillum rubrum ATCC 11170]AEO47383.1 putative FecR [Rhodospirillum rubrum F11]MBK5953237.1 iron dicitrate transport regulator FecR [Rhodospirillum rubrum]QXG81348.1 FecR domain-containing protein [Rhodospirillum rubrum]HCF18173.1 DUF4880 domain-containing protein [Rhodospirillum rubrum]